MKAEKSILEAHFPPCQWFCWADCFKKHKIHPYVDPCQLCEFHENSFKTATYIVTVIIIIIRRKPRSVIFEIEENPQGFAARKYTHSKENFMGNKLCSFKIFTKCVIF